MSAATAAVDTPDDLSVVEVWIHVRRVVGEPRVDEPCHVAGVSRVSSDFEGERVVEDRITHGWNVYSVHVRGPESLEAGKEADITLKVAGIVHQTDIRGEYTILLKVVAFGPHLLIRERRSIVNIGAVGQIIRTPAQVVVAVIGGS